jgi:hypothetical protein
MSYLFRMDEGKELRKIFEVTLEKCKELYTEKEGKALDVLGVWEKIGEAGNC